MECISTLTECQRKLSPLCGVPNHLHECAVNAQMFTECKMNIKLKLSTRGNAWSLHFINVVTIHPLTKSMRNGITYLVIVIVIVPSQRGPITCKMISALTRCAPNWFLRWLSVRRYDFCVKSDYELCAEMISALNQSMNKTCTRW